MGELIKIKRHNKRGKWQDYIDKAKLDYEQELERKRALYEQTGDAEIFTPEDIEAMIYENETFKAKNVDFGQIQKYNKLAEAAQWLEANFNDVVRIGCPPLPSGRVGYVCFALKQLAISNNEKINRTIAGMILLCDGLTISGVEDGVVKFTFFVRNLRTK